MKIGQKKKLKKRKKRKETNQTRNQIQTKLNEIKEKNKTE